MVIGEGFIVFGDQAEGLCSADGQQYVNAQMAIDHTIIVGAIFHGKNNHRLNDTGLTYGGGNLAVFLRCTYFGCDRFLEYDMRKRYNTSFCFKARFNVFSHGTQLLWQEFREVG